MKKVLSLICVSALLLTGCSTNQANKEEGISLVVATNNIDAKAQPDIPAQQKLLSENGVEIVGLQEVDNNTKRNPYDVVEKFKVDPYVDAFFSNAIDFSGGEYGIATVSKYEFESEDVTKLYSDLFAGEELSKELVEAYRNFDPENEESSEKFDAVSAKNPVEPRLYQRVVIEKEGKKIAFYNTHLSWENRELRKEQMETLKNAMDNDPCEYVIAVGDFNADQSTKEFDLFKNDYNLSNGKDGQWFDTYTGVDDAMMVNSVDNILVSKNIEIKEVKMVKSTLSDHNPLVAKLILK